MNRIKPRSGYTLIELLLVMSAAVVLMAVNVGWIHQTMKFSSLMKQRQNNHQNMTRLGWDLRDDVHHAHSMSMDGENRLVLGQNDGTNVTYSISENAINVERQTGDSAIQRDTFKLASNAVAAWDTSELPAWISLVVTRGREGVVISTSSDSVHSSLPDDSIPIDLHVRVSPDRWKTSQVDRTESETSEESK